MRVSSIVAGVIAAGGGAIELRGVARIVISDGTFDAAQRVTVLMTDHPLTPSGQTLWDVSVGPPLVPMWYDVRILTGTVMPTRSFDVTLMIPSAYLDSLPSTHVPAVFAQVVEGGDQESYEADRKLNTVYDPSTRSVRATVPLSAVGPPRLDDGVVETIVLVGSTLR